MTSFYRDRDYENESLINADNDTPIYVSATPDEYEKKPTRCMWSADAYVPMFGLAGAMLFVVISILYSVDVDSDHQYQALGLLPAAVAFGAAMSLALDHSKREVVLTVVLAAVGAVSALVTAVIEWIRVRDCSGTSASALDVTLCSDMYCLLVPISSIIVALLALLIAIFSGVVWSNAAALGYRTSSDRYGSKWASYVLGFLNFLLYVYFLVMVVLQFVDDFDRALYQVPFIYVAAHSVGLALCAAFNSNTSESLGLALFLLGGVALSTWGSVETILVQNRCSDGAPATSVEAAVCSSDGRIWFHISSALIVTSAAVGALSLLLVAINYFANKQPIFSRIKQYRDNRRQRKAERRAGTPMTPQNAYYTQPLPAAPPQREFQPQAPAYVPPPPPIATQSSAASAKAPVYMGTRLKRRTAALNTSDKVQHTRLMNILNQPS